MKFWKTFFQSFNVLSYKSIVKSGPKDSLGYFIKLFSLVFLLFIIISVPFMFSFPGSISEEFSKAEEFSFNIDFNSSEPLEIPPSDPFLIISENETQKKSSIEITNKEVIFNMIPFLDYRKSLDNYKDLSSEDSDTAFLFTIILLFLIPSLLVYLFLIYFLKYFFLVLIFSSLSFLIVRLLRKKIRYKKLFTASFYSLTPLILLEMILKPFAFPLYYIPLLLFIIWYIIIVIELIDVF